MLREIICLRGVNSGSSDCTSIWIIKMSWAKYKKHYKKDWESLPEFKNWLTGENDTAKCKLCNVNLRPHLNDLKRHAKGQKHSDLERAKKLQVPVQAFKPVEDLPISKRKRLELRIALHCAVSSSFRSLDSLGTILEDEMGKSGNNHIAFTHW